jgi:hypothetical protein
MFATPVIGSVKVNAAYAFEGHHWLEVPVTDWDDVKTLPVGLRYEGRTYGRTGWNSDRGVAYYSTRSAYAESSC